MRSPGDGISLYRDAIANLEVPHRRMRIPVSETACRVLHQQIVGADPSLNRRIAVVGEETELPYDRPPLSKEYLAGDKAWERMIFRSAEAWAEKRIDLVLGKQHTALSTYLRGERTRPTV